MNHGRTHSEGFIPSRPGAGHAPSGWSGRTSWPHDFVFLSFTQAFLAWWFLEGGKAGPEEHGTGEDDHTSTWRERVLRGRTPVMLVLLLASIALSNIVFFNFLGSFYHYGFFGFLFWANLLLLIVSYIELLPPALRRR